MLFNGFLSHYFYVLLKNLKYVYGNLFNIFVEAAQDYTAQSNKKKKLSYRMNMLALCILRA